LYNKLKVLSGMTPHEFILNTKLKCAARLLREQPDSQITEIAYKLGFSSLRYFSHCFKSQFGVTPNEFKRQTK
jgi:AraC-like DNA-binding protein